MEKYEKLWNYQQADLDLFKYESELKSTETRQRLLKLQKYIQDNQQLLRNMEGETFVRQNEFSEINSQYELISKQLNDAKEEIDSMMEDDLSELDLNYVRELIHTNEQNYESTIKYKKLLASLKNAIEKSNEDVKKIIQNMQKAKKQFDILKEAYDAEVVSAHSDLERRRREVDILSKQLDAELLKAYKRIKKNRKDPVAFIIDGKCSGCNMGLPSGALNTSHTNKILECENCGRLLMIKEN